MVTNKIGQKGCIQIPRSVKRVGCGKFSWDQYESSISMPHRAVSSRIVGCSEARARAKQIRKSLHYLRINSRLLPESNTQGLPCLEKRNFRRKVATFFAVAEAADEASTHLVK